MTFADFVKLYWKKLRRSGLPWTTPAIAEDSGLTVDQVNMYLAWLTAQPVMSDDQLIQKFLDTVTVITTPFGSYLGNKGVASGGATSIGDMPSDAFWVQLTKILGK